MPSWLARVSAFTLLALLAACGGTAARAPGSSPPAKLTIACSSISYAQIALPVAKETGIFARNGLDAEFILGPNGVPALLSGGIQGSIGSTEELIQAGLDGADLVTVCTMVPYLQHKLMVRPEIRMIPTESGMRAV